MKLMITWLRKDGTCRSWTNTEPHEHACMALTAYTDSVKRLSKIWKCSTQEVVNRINQMFDKKKKQTNADRFRDMTDEELAEELLFFAPTTLERAMYTGITGKYTETPEETIKNNLDWLKNPAESEE